MSEQRSDLDAALDTVGHELINCVLNLDMHGPDSGIVEDHVRRLQVAITTALGDGHGPFTMSFDEGYLKAASRPLVGPSLQARPLLDLVVERGIDALEFRQGIDQPELTRFLSLLVGDEQRDAFAPGGLENALKSRGIDNIQPILRDGQLKPANRSAVHNYQDLASCLQRNHVAAFHGREIEVASANGVVEQTLMQTDATMSELLSLAIYDHVDDFTVGHSVRVALLALQVARYLGADQDWQLRVGSAALLHDIGKSRITPEVLFKRGPLDDDEWIEMMQHPRLGAEILVEQNHIDSAAIGAAFSHHMAPGRKGYPQPDLPFEPSGISALVRVCDVFEALTAVRPYKAAITPVEAFAIMHRDPNAFDRRWLSAFVRAIGAYPVGTRLELDTGELATVVAHGPSPARPVVRVLSGWDDTADARLVTIGDSSHGLVRYIERVLLGGAAAAEPPEPGSETGKQPCC